MEQFRTRHRLLHAASFHVPTSRNATRTSAISIRQAYFTIAGMDNGFLVSHAKTSTTVLKKLSPRTLWRLFYMARGCFGLCGGRDTYPTREIIMRGGVFTKTKARPHTRHIHRYSFNAFACLSRACGSSHSRRPPVLNRIVPRGIPEGAACDRHGF